MAVGKNKRLTKGGKKGGKKKAGDPFLRKEWYDIKAPSPLACIQDVRAYGNAYGTKIATEELKGRVLEVNSGDDGLQKAWKPFLITNPCLVQSAPQQVNLADLNNDEDQASKKIRLCIEEAAHADGCSLKELKHVEAIQVESEAEPGSPGSLAGAGTKLPYRLPWNDLDQGQDLLSDQEATRLLLERWQTLIEAHVDVKTTDNYVVRMFCIAFTKRRQDQVKANCYAQWLSCKIRKIRKKMTEIMTQESASSVCESTLWCLCLFAGIPDCIAVNLQEIEKQAQGIFPLKEPRFPVKILKKPKFDITKLMELHGDGGDDMGVEMVRPEAEDAVNTLLFGWHRVGRAHLRSQLVKAWESEANEMRLDAFVPLFEWTTRQRITEKGTELFEHSRHHPKSPAPSLVSLLPKPTSELVLGWAWLALHLSLLALALQSLEDVPTEIATALPLLYSTDEALDILEKKVSSMEDFDARFPGFGGYMPWFCSRGINDAGVCKSTTDPGTSRMMPLPGWERSLPGLDNGQLAFGVAAVVHVLERRAAQEGSSGRFAQMARRWNGRLERMKASVVNLFYDGAGLVRMISQLDNITVDVARNASNAHNQNHMVLWDAFEGEMVVIFMDIFGNWSKYPNNGEEEKKLMWKIKAEHVEPVVYTAADKSKMVLQKGFWFSAHEQWKTLQLPYMDIPLVKHLFTNGEFARLENSLQQQLPGLMASVNAPHGVQCDAHPYCSAVGIQALAEQPIFTETVLTPYAAFPSILVDSAAGLAWYNHMLAMPRVQTPVGSIESFTNTGKAVAPMATWDAKATTVVAMLGGTGHLLRTYMEEHGVYGVFEDRVKSMYASGSDFEVKMKWGCASPGLTKLKLASMNRMREVLGIWRQVLQVCDELGIETVAAGMFIVPMQSWYSRDFISKALRQQHASATDADAKVTIDQWIQWPFPCGSDDAWKFFMRMNEAALRATLVAKTAFERFCDQPAQVMTMTHFLTRPELSFDWTIPGIWDHIGCEGLDEQIRTIGSDVHVYGRACTGPQVQEIDGLSYVHNYIGSTDKHRPGMAPFCIFDRGEILPTTQPSQANGFNFQPSARPQDPAPRRAFGGG
ncbi:RPS3A [Symbiodinium sp. CCMP2592]|nr:RPS3A [Symbiodinium sp. CCMP2592]